MIEPTRENAHKASIIADFLNRMGYMPYLFFDTGGVLKKCRDELELFWWYQKILKAEGKLK